MSGGVLREADDVVTVGFAARRGATATRQVHGGEAAISEVLEKAHQWLGPAYTAEGEFAGDTWHMDLDEAKDQASFEYGDAVQECQELPEEIDDPLAYVLSRMS